MWRLAGVNHAVHDDVKHLVQHRRITHMSPLRDMITCALSSPSHGCFRPTRPLGLSWTNSLEDGSRVIVP